MVPPALPAAIRADPKRSAEIGVYDALSADPLLKGFTVWYSSKWLAAHEGVLRDGEADFIVASPQIGFISIEVKGGRVRREAASGRWTSRDRDEHVHDIADPTEQALKSKKVLLKYLIDHWVGPAPFIWNRHGVVLPGGSRPKAVSDLGASMPLDIFAFHEDMSHLGARILQMMVWQPDGLRRSPGGFGEPGIRLIDQFYGRDVAFDISLKGSIEGTDAAILQLTREQHRLLDALQFMPRAHFQGGAGTGKTTLAVEKATRLAAEGAAVLLLCFNRPLRNHLHRGAAGAGGYDVMTFHELCGRTVREADVVVPSAPAAGSQKAFLEETLPRAFEEAVLSERVGRFDAILVDEAQDFRPGWIDAASLLLRPDGLGLLYVFSDDNQNLYAGRSARGLYGPDIALCDNYRNARPIFDVGSRFYRGEALRCRGPQGPDVRWVTSTRDRLARIVERQLNTLVLTEGIARRDIAVLVGRAVEASVFAGATGIGEHPICDAEDTDDGCITLDSVFRFKGLDKSVVVLADMDAAGAGPELPYVGVSRAKSLLIVVATDPALSVLGKPS